MKRDIVDSDVMKLREMVDNIYVEMLRSIVAIGSSKRRTLAGSDNQLDMDFVLVGSQGRYSSEDITRFYNYVKGVTDENVLGSAFNNVRSAFQFLICAGLDVYIEKVVVLLRRQSSESGIRISDNDFALLEFMLYLKNLSSFSHWELNIPTIGKQISSDMESYRGLRSGKIVEVLCPGLKGKSYLRPVVKVEGS
jgi:hypothetical protein